MSLPIPWHERTFTFDLQAGVYPLLVQRLRGTPARARELVSNVPEDHLSRRPDGRRWSPKEHLGHLVDLQPLDDLRLREYLSGAAALSAADPSNRATEAAGHNSIAIDTILSRLAAGRFTLVRELEQLSEDDWIRSARHPRLGRTMRLLDWAYFIAEHDDHHLAHAYETLRAAGATPGASRVQGGAVRPDSVRDLFDLPPDVTYLNCANMAPQLRSVTAAGVEAVRQKVTPWTFSGANWFTAAEEVRALAAAVAGVEADAIAIVPAASYGIAIAARNARVGSGQSIALLDREFPSNVYSWRRLARDRGARVVTIAREREESWTDAALRVLDEGTAVVAVPHCHWTDGSRIDLVRIGARARDLGAMLVVDASQSLGACPLDISQVQPDFLVAVGYKWLMGPYSLGYLYVAPRWRESGIPLEESWLTRAGADDFTGLVDYRDAYQPGARRFDMGEYPQFVLAPMAAAALRQVRSWSVEHIQGSLARLTDHAAELARKSGYLVEPRNERVGHMLGVRLPGGIPSDLGARLAAEKIYVSLRGDAIRIAPHLYNGEEDIDRLFGVLAR